MKLGFNSLHPDFLWGPPSFLFSKYGMLLWQVWTSQDVKLITCPHIVLRF